MSRRISYKLQFINGARLKTILLSSFVDNLAEEIGKIKCKYGHGNEKYETCRIKYKYCKCCSEKVNVKGNLITCKYYVGRGITKKNLMKT